ncbi:sodium:calcium antiporter [Patescibacteria group bacterium]|nr:MAG: sodium:calcium antiporter [Patescibacteria group bacterium]
MFFPLFLLLAGGVFLFKGAQFLVHGGSVLGLRLKIPPAVIGLTVVAFGTSAPEFFLNLSAALTGNAVIGLGDIAGANIANALLILGCAAVVGPVTVPRATLVRDVPIAIAATVLLALLANERWYSLSATNQLSFRDGLLFLGLFSVFIYALLVEKGMDGMRLIQHFRFRHAYRVSLIGAHSIPKALLEVFVSVFALWFGAAAFVRALTDLGALWGLPETLLGLTLAALGTTLPELSTTLVAAWRKEGDIVAGNLIGSVIFNTLFVLGAVSLVTPLPWPITLNADLGVLMGALVLIVLLLWRGRKRREISRGEGVVLILAYVVYAALLFGRFAS